MKIIVGDGWCNSGGLGTLMTSKLFLGCPSGYLWSSNFGEDLLGCFKLWPIDVAMADNESVPGPFETIVKFLKITMMDTFPTWPFGSLYHQSSFQVRGDYLHYWHSLKWDVISIIMFKYVLAINNYLARRVDNNVSLVSLVVEWQSALHSILLGWICSFPWPGVVGTNR